MIPGSLKPYPLEKLDLPDIPPYEPRRYYTICMACRDLYVQLQDPEQKKKVRYIATLAKAITDKLQQMDPIWFHVFYPRVEDYEKLMEDK